MTAFLLYIARSGLYLAVFYAFYLLVMRRTTFFRLNRVAVLAGSLLCALLPLLRVRTAPHVAVAGPLTIAGVEDGGGTIPEASLSWPLLLWGLYMAGVAVVAVVTLLSARSILRLGRKGECTRKEGFRTFILSGDQPSFTFGKSIYIGREDLEKQPAIFTHETMHVRCRHYLDLFFFRAVQILWWWNPLVWVMRTELGLLHEYEADEAVICKGIDTTQYQLLLVRKAVGEQRFSLASGFQHAQLKNRISMMLKPSSSGWMRLSYLALLPLLAALVYACNPSKNNKVQAPAEETETLETKAPDTPENGDAIPFNEVEVKPTFNGVDATEFSKWVNGHLTYPDAAKQAGIQGRVTLKFAIDTDGSVTDVVLLRGVDKLLDDEALRVVSNSPKWEPGKVNGEPVKVSYVFPIIFQLR